jgi:hypothetical protein
MPGSRQNDTSFQALAAMADKLTSEYDVHVQIEVGLKRLGGVARPPVTKGIRE